MQSNVEEIQENDQIVFCLRYSKKSKGYLPEMKRSIIYS